MKLLTAGALALGLAAAGAAAAQTATHSTSTQTATSANGTVSTAHGNAAVKDPTVAKTGVAAAGANSFTERQARDRITKAGYANVGKLMKSKDGLWAGRATKGGKKVRVALDFKGDVTAK